MTELQERASRLERRVGTGKEERKLVRVLSGTSGHYRLVYYDPRTKEVVRTESLTEAQLDEMRARGDWPTREQERRRLVVWSIAYYARWAMENFPDKYPTMQAGLDYARGHTDGGDDKREYERMFTLLEGRLTEDGGLPEGISSLRELAGV